MLQSRMPPQMQWQVKHLVALTMDLQMLDNTALLDLRHAQPRTS
jgi:hypothetical protein